MNFSFRPLWMKAAVASAAVATTTLLSASMASAAPTPVDLELFLSMDVSGSVDANEFDLQKTGYVLAFQDAAVHAAIESKPNGVAVALGQWSTIAANPAVGWSLLKTAADSNAFAASIFAMSRNFSLGSQTCISCGITKAAAELEANDYDGASLIDVSGDGEENVNANPGAVIAARNAAALLGIKINGLPIITNDFPNLDAYYENNVQTANGFTQPAASFADFDTAVKLKIVREITGDSVPGPLPILGAGVAFGFSRRLRKRINLATLA